MTQSQEQTVKDRFGATDAATSDSGGSNPLLAQILSRRTHRRYSDAPVSDGLIDLLTATALSASSQSDFQQATVIRVVDPDRRAALAAPFPAMPWIGKAPVFLVFCGDARRLERIGELRGHPQSNAGLEGFFNATVDAALVLQTFILAAESVGLGTCPISVLRNRVDLVAEVLGLPPLVFPVAGLCVGYPDAAGFVSLRLPRAVTSLRDAYSDENLASLVDQYDRERDARHSIPASTQRNPEKFATAAFYGWSEDKARQAASPEGEAFPPFLRRSGFTFA